jgi:hypothetical protein
MSTPSTTSERFDANDAEHQAFRAAIYATLDITDGDPALDITDRIESAA